MCERRTWKIWFIGVAFLTSAIRFCATVHGIYFAPNLSTSWLRERSDLLYFLCNDMNIEQTPCSVLFVFVKPFAVCPINRQSNKRTIRRRTDRKNECRVPRERFRLFLNTHTHTTRIANSNGTWFFFCTRARSLWTGTIIWRKSLRDTRR